MTTPSFTSSLIRPEGIDGSPPGELPPQKLIWFRNYFRPHFDDWVFGPIDRLVHAQDALIGFILMACAVDYLSGFWSGKSSKRAYTDFIDQYFPKGRYDATGVYDSLRNGLVHMFTIKNKKYALTHNNPQLHLTVNANRQIVLNAGDLRDDLRAAKEHYFNDVESRPDLLDRLFARYSREGFLDLASSVPTELRMEDAR
jgi:hypothetical protein